MLLHIPYAAFVSILQIEDLDKAEAAFEHALKLDDRYFTLFVAVS